MPNITMQMIADMTGVSLKTVSRVVNKESGVSQSTRSRVEAVIKELDFQPNPAARGLAAARSFLIALLYDNPSMAYIIGLQRGILSTCRDHNFNLLINPCDQLDSDLTEAINALIRSSRVEGLVLTPPLSDNQALLDMLDKRQTKYVRISPLEESDRSPLVYADEQDAARRMTDYLISQGHVRIGFITGHPNRSGTVKRLAGYRQAMADHGLSVDEELIVTGHYTFESGERAARQMLRLQNRPTAIFASNDYMASGALKVATQMKIRVPHELSIAGYDDAPLAERLWPRLTTMRHPVESLARIAADLLIRHLNGEKVAFDPETLHTELVIRQSTAPLLD